MDNGQNNQNEQNNQNGYTPYDPYANNQGYPQYPYPPEPPSSYPGKGYCIAALVLGIIGLNGSLVLSILAIIFGTKGRRMSSEVLGEPSKMATAGLVCGIIGVIICGIAFACVCAILPGIIAEMEAAAASGGY